MELSPTIERSALWARTLGEGASHREARERLRSSYIQFRERAAQLAVEIRRDLPDLTVHDITHLDALWEVGSQIMGSGFRLTPVEGYVLGGAILLHDLAMSVAATPGGAEAIRADPRYRDLIFLEYEKRFGRVPSSHEIEHPDEYVRSNALFGILRVMHAENAEKLAFMSFNNGGLELFLIDDAELRQTFGRLIGQIAHSHWWTVSELERQFSRTIGAPAWAPAEWTIDPLKIACILRAADAAHIDARRAPAFMRSFSNISSASQLHWAFQEKLNKPYVREDALVFTSGYAFPLSEASAWWLCVDALRMVDRELREIDSLLAEKGGARFAARRVAGVDSPERLASYVPTCDWFPINATVHVSDLPHIIRSIGGEELYGADPKVPLRELIQNACDAVRARRVIERRPANFGEVRVSLVATGNDSFILEVADNGVGMSRRVLTDFLLDFGSSLWSSSQAQEEFPGLLSSGFRATGRYGIGFFSVFMISEKLRVVTRRGDAAAKDTLVLEFGSGLAGRPILRPAQKAEQLIDGGTIVSVHLSRDPRAEGGLLYRYGNLPPISLEKICAQIAPAVDVDLVVSTGAERTKVIEANDWSVVPGEQFLARLRESEHGPQISKEVRDSFMKRAAENLRLLVDEDGSILGRACISTSSGSYRLGAPEMAGVVTVGGLGACGVSGVLGVLPGRSTKAARDEAMPLVSRSVLAKWATEQARLVPHLYPTPEGQRECASLILACGGSAGALPIAEHGKKWVSADDISRMPLGAEIIILDRLLVEWEFKHIEAVELAANVFVTQASMTHLIVRGDEARRLFGVKYEGVKRVPPLVGAIAEAAAMAWGTTIQAIARVNDLEKEESVTIGATPDGKAIRTRALRITRPPQQGAQ